MATFTQSSRQNIRGIFATSPPPRHEQARQQDGDSERAIAEREDPRLSVELHQVVNPRRNEVAVIARLPREGSQAALADGKRAGDATQTLGHDKSDGRQMEHTKMPTPHPLPPPHAPQQSQQQPEHR